jgi:hypothetical protein
MGEAFLCEFDSDSSSLADRLDGIIERIESTAAPATRTAICSR